MRFGAADFGAALLVLVFIFSFAVVFTLNFRPLYMIYMLATEWYESVGMTLREVLVNYEALIEYNSIFHIGALEFPSLALSPHGRIHYEEVKHIFIVFEIACYASLAALIPTSIFMLKRHRMRFLKYGAYATLTAVVAVLIFFSAADWNKFFVKFHETFFSNDYWIFDAKADPSILILPDGYFLTCTVTIFAMVIGLSAAAIITTRRMRKRECVISSDRK
jgi:integral membrane protein (TIGR01906 family)